METTTDDEGHTKYIYRNQWEYKAHQNELYRTMGRRQLIYEGWLNGELVRIMRR